MYTYFQTKFIDNCGEADCVEYNSNYLGWEKKGIGRMIVFMAIEGFVYYTIVAIIEFQVVKTIVNFFKSMICEKSVHPNSEQNSQLDDNVEEEKKRILTSSLETLQKTDHLIFK